MKIIKKIAYLAAALYGMYAMHSYVYAADSDLSPFKQFLKNDHNLSQLRSFLLPYLKTQPEKVLYLPDGSQILTGSGFNRFYQELPFGLYKRKNGEADEPFGNVPPITKAANPFEQKAKAVILVPTRDTYTSAVTQLRDGSLVAAGPYEKNKVMIGKWNAAGQPDTTFGDNAKVIVKLHEKNVVAGSELSSPKLIVEKDNGDIVVFGALTQGKNINPFIILLAPNGIVKEKYLLDENYEMQNPDEQMGDMLRERELRNQLEEQMNPGSQTQQSEVWVNKYPTVQEKVPGMISESERRMNTYPTRTEETPGMISSKQAEEQMNKINP